MRMISAKPSVTIARYRPESQARDTHDQPRDGGHEGADHDGDKQNNTSGDRSPGRSARLDRCTVGDSKERRRVRPDRHETCVADRELPGKAVYQVQRCRQDDVIPINANSRAW